MNLWSQKTEHELRHLVSQETVDEIEALVTEAHTWADMLHSGLRRNHPEDRRRLQAFLDRTSFLPDEIVGTDSQSDAGVK